MYATTKATTASEVKNSISGMTIATLMGVPASTAFVVGDLPSDVPTQQVSDAVESLMTRAVTERPDLVSGGERARVTDDDRRLQGSTEVSVVMLVSEGVDSSNHLSHVGLG